MKFLRPEDSDQEPDPEDCGDTDQDGCLHIFLLTLAAMIAAGILLA